jgi:hypothetical protein
MAFAGLLNALGLGGGAGAAGAAGGAAPAALGLGSGGMHPAAAAPGAGYQMPGGPTATHSTDAPAQAHGPAQGAYLHHLAGALQDYGNNIPDYNGGNASPTGQMQYVPVPVAQYGGYRQ